MNSCVVSRGWKVSTPASNFLRAAPRKCRPSSVRRRRVRFHHTHCGRRFPSGHGGRLLNLRSRKKKPKKIKTRREYTHISPRVIGCASMPVASVDCFLKKQKKKSIESSFSCVDWTVDEEIFWFRQPKRKCEWCNSFILGLIFFLMIVIFIKLLRDSWMLHSRNRRLKKKHRIHREKNDDFQRYRSTVYQRRYWILKARWKR